MNKAIFAAIGTMLLAAGCQHFTPTETSADTAQLVDTAAIETFVIDAIYTQHPTRALVDHVTVTPAAELGRYMVHVEMTGGAEFRDIFDAVVIEGAEGALELVSLDQIQGS